MDISIIINTYNQYSYIDRCISSCISQNFNGRFEVIVVDSSNDQNDYKKIYKKFNKIKLIKKEQTSNYPCINQMESIKDALNISKGKIICLLDGDDFFEKNKISLIYNNFNNKKFVNQDIPILLYENENIKKNQNIKFFKSNFLYKYFINSWMNIFGTSCLSCDRETLEKFFIENDNYNYPFLAIDTLLVNDSVLKKKYFQIGSALTVKSINNQNLDKKYSGILNRKFWLRRIQQHNYFRSKQKYYNIDYFITFLINKFRF